MGRTDTTASPSAGESFDALLRHYRLAAGLTQETLAAAAGLSVRGISDLERGVNHAPRPDTVCVLADALGLSPRERTHFEAAVPRTAGAARTGGLPITAPALPPLVGRDREVAALETFLAGEGPPVLLFAGPPGIGKSRLLQEARGRAEAAGWRVLMGGCQRRGGQEPFAPIAEAIEHHLAARSPVGLRAVLRGCAWLVRLLPELAGGPIEPLPPWQVSPEHERRLMFRAVAAFLANVAGPAGTLLVLDDLQWSGADALDLLAAVVALQATGLPSSLTAPVRVLGAYRDTEVRPHDAFALLLADLARAELVAHRALGPLADEDAQYLLEALLTGTAATDRPAPAQQLARRVGGIPFFLVSWARHLRAMPPDEGAGQDLPWDLRQSIRDQVAALTEGAQAVLGLAAVAGRETPGVLLLAAAEQPEAATLTALEEACRAQLLQETGEGSYRFAHDVLHEMVESGVGSTRRALQHRRLAAALERQPGEPQVEALAFHHLRGGDREKAVLYLERAGDRAVAQHADAAAEASYLDLVTVLEALGRARSAVRVQEKLAAVLTRRSRYTEALAVLERAAQAYRDRQAWTDLARVTARLGTLHAEMGTTADGMRLVQPVVARLEPLGASPELVDLYLTINDLGMHAGESAPRLEVTARALALARTLGEDVLLAEVAGGRGSVLIAMGRFQEALAVLEEGQQHLVAAGSPVSLGAIRVLAFLAGAQRGSGLSEASRRTTDRALEMAEQFGDSRYIGWLLCERANGRMISGDWMGAGEDNERAVALHRQIGLSHGSAGIISALGHLRLHEGKLEEATRLFEEARDYNERIHNARWIWELDCCLAETARRAGRAREARVRLLELCGRLHAAEAGFPEALIYLARAHLDMGEVRGAAQALERIADLPGGSGAPMMQIEVLAVRALVATGQGRWAEAEQCLAEGFSLARSVVYPYGESRLLHASGLLLARQGLPARAQLEAALAIVARLGARTDLATIAADLATLAHPPPVQ